MRVWSGQTRPSFVLALPIFPVRLQTSIFGASELNFRVRDGNGWTLTAISTNLLFFEKKSKQKKLSITFFSLPFFSTVRYYIQFSPNCQELFAHCKKIGDPYGNRTHVCGVRGRRLNRLTNGPSSLLFQQSPPRTHPASWTGPLGAPSRIRTGDPLIKSQLLYQLS